LYCCSCVVMGWRRAIRRPMRSLFLALIPAAFITLPFWLDRAVAMLCRPAFPRAVRLARSLRTDPEWHLSPNLAAHPGIGFLRLRSGLVGLIDGGRWKMGWIERRIVAAALRGVLRAQALASEAEWSTARAGASRPQRERWVR